MRVQSIHALTTILMNVPLIDRLHSLIEKLTSTSILIRHYAELIVLLERLSYLFVLLEVTLLYYAAVMVTSLPWFPFEGLAGFLLGRFLAAHGLFDEVLLH